MGGGGTVRPNVNFLNRLSNSAICARLGFGRGALADGGISIAPKFESVSEDVFTGISPKACAFRVWLLPRRFGQLPYAPDHETPQCPYARFPEEHHAQSSQAGSPVLCSEQHWRTSPSRKAFQIV